MKYFIRIFVIAFVCFALAIGVGSLVYMQMYEPLPERDDSQDVVKIDSGKGKDVVEVEKSPLEKAYENSERINMLLVGLEGPRTDTLIFASFDMDTKKLNMISIPRDTYYKQAGESKGKKINSVYASKGMRGIMDAAQDLLCGIPLDYYVSVKYKGVEEIINSLDGIEVVVEQHMKYDDTGEGRDLHIDILPGKQVLDGENSVKFLRWRKNNDGTGYSDGDLGRIRTQQRFLKLVAKKALSLKLPAVINTARSYVKTNISPTKVLLYANKAKDMNVEEDISMITLPGEAKKGDYFRVNKDNIEKYLENMYGVK